MYELYIEGYKVDIDQKLSIALTYAIDDISNYGSRETSFSKQITIPGTAYNNLIFGYIYDLASYNPYDNNSLNIGSSFNVAQTSRVELRLNGLLVLKGVFRVINIIKERDLIEYEGAIFGELSGFITHIAGSLLEDLKFDEYNHFYNFNNIVNSWNTINGQGYYYPLIDYGTHSSGDMYGLVKAKTDFNYLTFRPALYVKEYLDKIFEKSGYTYESNFINSSFFKKFIIPNNQTGIFKKANYNVQGLRTNPVTTTTRVTPLNFESTTLSADWTVNVGNNIFTYIGATPQVFNFSFQGTFKLTSATDQGWSFEIRKNGVVVYTSGMGEVNGVQFTFNDSGQISVQQNDEIRINVRYPVAESVNVVYKNLKFLLFNSVSGLVQVTLNGLIEISQTIPKGILQKDFFVWILQMFNLYVTDDKLKDKHLIIEPYIDFYNSNEIDWTYKVERDKPWQIKPMGMLNGRFFEYQYKEDSDYYNEAYKKKYNITYGGRLEDTKYQFSKDKQTIDIGFSPSVLVQYQGRDKVMPAIYKKSKGNSVDQEELIESNIRILIAKKMNCNTWNIRNGKVESSPILGTNLNIYGYAGHFDDPINPTKDLNFGACEEIFFSLITYTTNNLFNNYWSEYIAEIADKDSKILTCYVHLTPLDIAQLDFSRPIRIDNVLFRINKIIDYDYVNNELVKVELLKIINNG